MNECCCCLVGKLCLIGTSHCAGQDKVKLVLLNITTLSRANNKLKDDWAKIFKNHADKIANTSKNDKTDFIEDKRSNKLD